MKQKTKTRMLTALVGIAFLFLPLMAYVNKLGYNELTMRLLAGQCAVIFLGLVIFIVVEVKEEKR